MESVLMTSRSAEFWNRAALVLCNYKQPAAGAEEGDESSPFDISNVGINK